MNLPKPGDRYSRTEEEQRNREIEKADRENFKRFQDIELQPPRGGRPGTRIILRSPDGSRWALSVDDMGSLSVVSA